MNEGDVAVVLSQYGEIADICLMRDKKTKKSRGFAYVAYVDQRSTDLAVDNLNGALVCGRYIKVDHVRDYKLPKEAYILEAGETPEGKAYRPTGPDGKGWGNFRALTEDEEQQIKELADEVEHSKAVAQAKQARYNDTMFFSATDQDKLFEENQERMEMLYQNQELIKIKQQYQQLMEEKQRKKEEKRAKKEKKRAKKEMKKQSKDKSGDGKPGLDVFKPLSYPHHQSKVKEEQSEPAPAHRATRKASRSVTSESEASREKKKHKKRDKSSKHKKEKKDKKKKENTRKRDRSRSKDHKQAASEDSEAD